MKTILGKGKISLLLLIPLFLTLTAYAGPNPVGQPDGGRVAISVEDILSAKDASIEVGGDLGGIWQGVEDYGQFGTFDFRRTYTPLTGNFYLLLAERPTIPDTSENGFGVEVNAFPIDLATHVCYGYPGCGPCKYIFIGQAVGNTISGTAIYRCDGADDIRGTFKGSRVKLAVSAAPSNHQQREGDLDAFADEYGITSENWKQIKASFSPELTAAKKLTATWGDIKKGE